VVGKSPSSRRRPRTLSVDIGGTGIKMLVLDPSGAPVTERTRVRTPQPATPRKVLSALAGMLPRHRPFDRASVGFPGVVQDGIVKTAPNLDDRSWRGFPFQATLRRQIHRPVRVCNDADMQGFGAVQGRGVEMVITLGTGVGSALFIDGTLVPNLELGHHPYHRGKTYEDMLGQDALDEIGKTRWRRRVRRAVAQIEPIWNYLVLYIGGGNSRLLDAADLPGNVKIVANKTGLLGGIALWKRR